MFARIIVGSLSVLCLGAWSPAGAQTTVYKCGFRSYSEVPCSKRVVSTKEASVPVRPVDARRLERSRILAASLRRMPGETGAEFDTRRRWARMLPEDGAECARLDKRIPVEKARMDHPDPEVIENAEHAMTESKKRFRQMRC